MGSKQRIIAMLLMLTVLATAAASTPRLQAHNARPAAAIQSSPEFTHPNAQLNLATAVNAPRGDRQWTPLGGPTYNGGFVTALVQHGGDWYAAVSDPGTWERGTSTLYRQNGATWEAVLDARYRIVAMASAGTTLIAGAAAPDEAGFGLYITDDGGDSWSVHAIFEHGGALPAVAVRGNTVLAAGGEQGGEHNRWAGTILLSHDDGLNWTDPRPGPVDDDRNFVFTAAAIDPLTPTTMLVAGHWMDGDDSQVYRSTDNGATWAEIATIPGAHVKSLLYHPTSVNRLYAGTGSSPYTGGPAQVHRSDDGGATWDLVFGDGGGWLAFAAPGTVYACAEWGTLFRSQADGTAGSWEGISGMPGCSAFALGGSKSLIGSGEHGVFSSTNLLDWQDDNAGITSRARITGIAIDPNNRQRLYVASPIGGGFASSDGGATWQTPNGLGVSLHSVAVDPAQPTIVFAGAANDRNGALLRSTDGGANFTTVYTAPFIQPDGSGGAEEITGLAVAPTNHLVVYAVGTDNINWGGAQAVALVSTNGGDTWTRRLRLPADSWFEAVAVSATNNQLVYAGGTACDAANGCRGALYRSTNRGVAWTQVLVTDQTITSIVIAADDDRVVYVADRGYEVRRSTDGGATWMVIRANWQVPEYPPSGYLLAADPHQAGRIYLGGWGYLAETPDGGNSWSNWDQPLNAGTPPMEPSALAVDSGDVEQTLYAGFTGLWSYTRVVPQDGNRYVATGGSDALNACTDPATPCATVQYAIDLANANETVYIAAGTYTERLTLTRPVTLTGGLRDDFSGMAPAPTVLDGAGGGRDGGSVVAMIGGETYVLRDLHLTGGNDAVAGAVHVTANSDVTLERCFIHANHAVGSQDSWGGAIVQHAGTLTIVDSQIMNNTIEQFGASAVRVGSEAALYMTNVLVAGNTGDMALHTNSGGMLINVTIANNPDGPGVLFNAAAPHRLDIHNAIIWDNGDWIHTPSDGTLVVSHSDVQGGVWPGTGNISADPQFVGGGLFYLRFGSPAVDSGRGFAGGASDHDLDGRARPQDGDLDGVARWDMGVYERPAFRLLLPLLRRPDA